MSLTLEVSDFDLSDKFLAFFLIMSSFSPKLLRSYQYKTYINEKCMVQIVMKKYLISFSFQICYNNLNITTVFWCQSNSGHPSCSKVYHFLWAPYKSGRMFKYLLPKVYPVCQLIKKICRTIP